MVSVYVHRSSRGRGVQWGGREGSAGVGVEGHKHTSQENETIAAEGSVDMQNGGVQLAGRQWQMKESR